MRVKKVLRLADIVIDALTMAWFRKTPTPGLIHHSERGSQYASHAFQARANQYGMVCSMTARGIAGQRAHRELLQQSEECAGAWRPL